MDKKRKKRLCRLYFKALAITLAVCLGVLTAMYGIFLYMVGGLHRAEIDESNLSVNEELEQYEKITNLVFYGVDGRDHDYQGRSDVIMVVSINGKTGKIKLISIARDTYVSVPGYYDTKINHAYAYGGAELAIQTLNENFGLDITDYVTVNFDSLADVIDEMGGIDLEISEGERQQINAYLLSGEPLQESGMVHLNGPQAVSYSRIRKIGGDDMRMERQRKVLSCLFEKAREINPLQYPSYVRKFAPMVETSLSNEEILKIASVGLKGSSLVLEQAAFPNEYIASGGQYIGSLWYYVYDIDQAADMLHQFIYEDIPFGRYGQAETDLDLTE